MDPVDIPALSFSEEKFRGVFQGSRDAMLLFDAATGVVVDANPAAEHLLERSLAELVGMRQGEIFAALSPVEGGPWETVIHGARQLIPVSLTLSSFMLDRWRILLAVFRDIRPRKVTEEMLRIQDQALRHAGDVIVIADLAGAIRFANPACARILAMPVEALVNQPWQRLERILGEPGLLDQMIHTLRQGQAWRRRITGQSDQGEFALDVAVTPIHDAAGQVERLLLVGRDILKEVRLERLLLQAQKLEAIGTMAGGVAHDFNNILFAILGRVELAMDPLNEEDPLWSHLREIRVSARRAQDLVKQLLAFSRVHKGERSPISLVETVRESLDMLRTALPAAVRIETHFSDDTPAVLADATQLCQVMINLGTNAAYAMGSEGGVMEVVVERVQLPEDRQAFPHLDLPDGVYAMLSVRDSGAGIPEAYQGLIFDPFFTTKPIGKGTGLGLSVVHGVVKHHGGSVQVQSLPGEGALFRIFLPASPRPLLSRQDGQLPPRGSERVLVVDDDALVTAVLEAYLTSLGYRVTARTNPQEAWRLFHDHPDHYDLVMADRLMPGLGGEVFLQQVQTLRPGLPGMIITGCDEELLGRTDPAPGHAIHKPFSKKDLAVAVRRCLDHDPTPPE